MAEKTIVDKAGETIGVGIAMASDVAGAVKTAFDAAVTTVTEVLKKAPVMKVTAQKALKKAPIKKVAKKAAPKKAAKKTPAKKALKKVTAKKIPAKKAAKKSVRKTAQKAGRRQKSL
jgi:hypothetical protein